MQALHAVDDLRDLRQAPRARAKVEMKIEDGENTPVFRFEIGEEKPFFAERAGAEGIGLVGAHRQAGEQGVAVV